MVRRKKGKGRGKERGYENPGGSCAAIRLQQGNTKIIKNIYIKYIPKNIFVLKIITIKNEKVHSHLNKI